MVKVSVIVPSYKRKRNLVKRALDSLLSQTYKDIEIVLVDDNAGENLKEYREENESLVKELNSDKIILIKNEKNLGGSGSRNAGIMASSGEYITFLDDDDRYLPEKIEKQLNFMIENNLDMSFTDLRMHNERDKLIDFREYSKIKSFDNDYLMRYHLTRQITGTLTFMYKREVLFKINLFEDVCMGQEYYLMSKTIQSNASIGYLRRSDVIGYRYDIEAISTGPNKIKGEKLLYNYKKKFFKKLKLNEKIYVMCRHYAVMAVAYKRNKRPFKCLQYLLTAAAISPYYTVKEFVELLGRRKKFKDK